MPNTPTAEFRDALAESIARIVYPLWDTWQESEADESKPLEYEQSRLALTVDALYPLIAAQARLDAIAECLAALIEAAPPLNAELSMNGATGEPVTDPGMAAYVEGFHDAWAAINALLIDSQTPTE